MWLGTRKGLHFNGKPFKVQRKTLKDLQKPWRTIAVDHFKRLQECKSIISVCEKIQFGHFGYHYDKHVAPVTR